MWKDEDNIRPLTMMITTFVKESHWFIQDWRLINTSAIGHHYIELEPRWDCNEAETPIGIEKDYANC